jgi:hypothetical protein
VKWQGASDAARSVHRGDGASHDGDDEIERFVYEAELIDEKALKKVAARVM